MNLFKQRYCYIKCNNYSKYIKEKFAHFKFFSNFIGDFIAFWPSENNEYQYKDGELFLIFISFILKGHQSNPRVTKIYFIGQKFNWNPLQEFVHTPYVQVQNQ